jgi:hypothetical protein
MSPYCDGCRPLLQGKRALLEPKLKVGLGTAASTLDPSKFYEVLVVQTGLRKPSVRDRSYSSGGAPPFVPGVPEGQSARLPLTGPRYRAQRPIPSSGE